jgi:glucose-1-phosphate cytidylyltransferase
MICLILCGGFGTRMNNGEPGDLKPLIDVAGKEILAHIISIYESQGILDFILLARE